MMDSDNPVVFPDDLVHMIIQEEKVALVKEKASSGLKKRRH